METRPIRDISGIERKNLRVETLTQLRWLALFGQLFTVLGVSFGLRFDLPLHWCFSVIGASAILNVFIDLYVPRSLRLEETQSTFLLIFDIIQLSLLLFFVGGLENPFSILILAPVTIASVSLRFRQIVVIVVLAIICASLLSVFHWPLPWFANEFIVLPPLYRLGLWAALLVAAVFISTYAAQVAREARNLSLALTATELVLERQNHLSRLDGLAAAAAHELGTPLATIALVTRELRSANVPPAFAEDIDLLNQQAQRCRNILGRITSLATDENAEFDKLKLRYWIEKVVTPFRNQSIAIEINTLGSCDEPVLSNNPALAYGIGNFVENAVDFAKTKVVLNLFWTEDVVSITIFDDGLGFSNEILGQIGEPYLKTRAGRRLKTGDSSGLGLGIFISKTLLERTGAELQFSNRQGAGASVQLTWRRGQLEVGLKHSFSRLSSFPDFRP